jgi:hypothetical protein
MATKINNNNHLDTQKPNTLKDRISGFITSSVNNIREKLYNNVIPFSYGDITNRLYSAIVNNKPYSKQVMPDSGNYDALDEIYANYLQISKNKRHYDPVLKTSKYKPSKSKDKNALYYAMPLTNKEKQRLIKAALNGATSEVNPELGEYKIGLGEDVNGKYASYYDNWDINPFRGVTSYDSKLVKWLGLDKIGDLSFGIGKPVEIYDRLYYDENGKLIDKKLFGGLVTRRSLATGGKIYIKPSHRGRLTELKERTGKSEAELYNDGNPAHKKMVVFARNARKWNK